MPQPTTYKCTKCDFSGSSYNTWGSHSYLINDALIPINRAIAFCYSCDSIVAAEVLPGKDEVVPVKEDSDSVNPHQAIKEKTSEGSPYFFKIFDKLISLISFRNSERLRKKSGLKQQTQTDEAARFEALKNRKSSARCLACGSHDFQLMPIQWSLNKPHELIHRNCGGMFYAVLSQISFSMGDMMPKSIYDTEGIQIKNPD